MRKNAGVLASFLILLVAAGSSAAAVSAASWGARWAATGAPDLVDHLHHPVDVLLHADLHHGLGARDQRRVRGHCARQLSRPRMSVHEARHPRQQSHAVWSERDTHLSDPWKDRSSATV